mgnify:CR=1 FL=1
MEAYEKKDELLEELIRLETFDDVLDLLKGKNRKLSIYKADASRDLEIISRGKDFIIFADAETRDLYVHRYDSDILYCFGNEYPY